MITNPCLPLPNIIGFVVKTHIEKIQCVNCDTVQLAIVEHTYPWWGYSHICVGCNTYIGESEWNNVK